MSGGKAPTGLHFDADGKLFVCGGSGTLACCGCGGEGVWGCVGGYGVVAALLRVADHAVQPTHPHNTNRRTRPHPLPHTHTDGRIYVATGTGLTETTNPGGAPSSLAADAEGQMFVCDAAIGAVAHLKADGTYDPILTEYEGTPLKVRPPPLPPLLRCDHTP